MDAEKEMLTSDGLGAALKAELRDVTKDKGFKLFDDFGHELEEGDEVHLEGYGQKEGRGVVASLDESDGYVVATIHFHDGDFDEEFDCYIRHDDDSAYIANEFEKQ